MISKQLVLLSKKHFNIEVAKENVSNGVDTFIQSKTIHLLLYM